MLFEQAAEEVLSIRFGGELAHADAVEEAGPVVPFPDEDGLEPGLKGALQCQGVFFLLEGADLHGIEHGP